jgi:hypothetical protein
VNVPLELKPQIRRCPRCKRWEVWYPTPNWEGGEFLVVEGFKTWLDALTYALTEAGVPIA